MTSAQIIVLILVILVVAAAVFVGWTMMRRQRLRSRFGPEYERVVAEEQSRTAGERVLRDRERRFEQLDLRPIDEATRRGFTQRWRAVQAEFVDDPASALTHGDALFAELVAARGYPTDDRDEQLAALSVEHARPLHHYREAHGIYRRASAGHVSTEDQRQALVHYREIIADLLGESSLESDLTDGAVASTTERKEVDHG